MKVKVGSGFVDVKNRKEELYDGELYLESIDYIIHRVNYHHPEGYKVFEIGDTTYFIHDDNLNELLMSFDIHLIGDANTYAMTNVFIKSDRIISKHEVNFDNNSDKYDYDVYILKNGNKVSSPMRNYEKIPFNKQIY